MKKLYLPLLLLFIVPFSFSCASGKLGNYTLTEKDAAEAVRQLLQMGARNGNFAGAFSKEAILSTVFPEPVKKVLNTIDQLGLTSEVDRFTTTLSQAAEKSAERSVPIFISGIAGMKLTDAMRIVKNGGTSATDYLRATVGDSLRRSLRPVMQTALDEYKLNEQWDNMIKPVKSLAGSKLNLDLANLMAGIVSEKMFQKMAEQEQQIRANAAARTTPLLKKVFSRSWN